ncbi:N-acetyllactosaminide beta-1,6-N-acetylglucosaminyl-transferase [Lepisosteus oculatus]|uniref:N-acetyllactosaminide beta-1,6-N-acetylglucosaminyl-transferase n=1 Tax=Lepisosteus oculatus TaxID=7918 RepID=UPI0035F50569
MLQLHSTKRSFLVCLGICILVCAAIYVKVSSFRRGRQQAPVEAGRCKLQARTCSFALAGPEEAEWHQKQCLEYDEAEASFLKGELNCSRLVEDFHFITSPLSPEEEEFPLAFILTIHKDLEMFLRLLRAIYAPQNVYCIHVDRKSPPDYKAAVARLGRCFPNVFLASATEDVTYGGFSRLQADIHCMRDLLKSPVPWKRVANLCGQDFPTQSNWELVRYLRSKEWRDRNMTPGVKQPPSIRQRTQLKHREIKGSYVVQLRERKEPPPHNLEIYFGTAYYSLTRPFVEFVLHSQIAKDLLEWSKDTYSPDEHYWVTLNHLPEAPGSHPNGGWEGDIRAIKWRDQAGASHDGCKGHYVRDICIYGTEDLQWIISRNSMFANKFELSTYPQAVECLELWHRKKVLQQAKVPIDPAWLLVKEHNHTKPLNMSNSP